MSRAAARPERPSPARMRCRYLIASCLVVAAGVLAFAGWTLYATVVAARNAHDSVLHAYEVLRTIENFRDEFRRFAAPPAERVAGSQPDPGERSDAIAAAEDALRYLHMLSAADPAQQKSVARLAAIVAERGAGGEQRRRDGKEAFILVGAFESEL